MMEKICIILLANILFYAKTITYGYVSDDVPAVRNPPKFRNKFEKLFLQIRGSLKIDKQMDHFITLIIHALVCVGIYLAFGKSDISFLAALYFTFNPINNQGSVWMSGRGYVFAALFNVWAIAIPVLAPVFMFCSAYYNLGYVAPLILIGSPIPWIMLVMPAIWWFWRKKFKNDVVNKAKLEMFAEDKQIKPEKFVLAVKTFGFYFVHALLPIKTTFYHSFLQSAAGSLKHKAYTWKDRFFWIGLVVIIGILAYWFTHEWTMVSFGLLWWCIGIAPFCNFMRLSQEIAERYAYLPNAGLMYVLAYLTVNYPIVAAVFLAMYATKMWFYMDAYQDDYYLVEQACLNSPDSWFAWHVRAIKRWDAKSIQEATIFWVMAKRISPKEFKILFNLATVCAVANQKKEALEFIKLAEQNIPGGQEKFANGLIAEWHSGKFGIVL